MMPITKDQAQMLATLAVAARPHGAPRWQHAGVMAALAKVAHLNLVDVALATMRAADNPALDTPGAIGNPATAEWGERNRDRAQPRSYDQGPICGYCDLPRDDVKAKHGDDHDWEPQRGRMSTDDAQPHRDRARAAVRAARGMGDA